MKINKHLFKLEALSIAPSSESIFIAAHHRQEDKVHDFSDKKNEQWRGCGKRRKPKCQ